MTLNDLLAYIPGNKYKSLIGAAGVFLVALAKVILIFGSFMAGETAIPAFLADTQDALTLLWIAFGTLASVGIWHKKLKGEIAAKPAA